MLYISFKNNDTKIFHRSAKSAKLIGIEDFSVTDVSISATIKQ